MDHRGRLLALAIGLTVLAPRTADACEPLGWELQILLPPADVEAMPRDGAFLAYVIAPNGEEENVTLTRVADGTEVPVNVVVTLNGSHEQAMLQVNALEPLDANTEYVWNVGGVEQGFFTHEGFDAAFPSSGALAIDELGEGVGGGCWGDEVFADYEVQIQVVSEPVASYAVLNGDGYVARFAPGQGSLVPLRLYGEGVQCYDLMIVDHGGHIANAGSTCLAGPGTSAGSTGGDGTAGDDTGPSMSTSTSGDADESGPVDSGGDMGTPPQVGDSAVDRGCACRAGTESGTPGAMGWLLLAALGVHRRRRHRGPRAQARPDRA